LVAQVWRSAKKAAWTPSDRGPRASQTLNGIRRTEKGGRKTVVEWGVAAKIALGGLGMVVIILLILCLTVWMTKSIVEKIEGGEKEK